MSKLKIISATPGPNTMEIILDLVKQKPGGITTKELYLSLNRPVSMIQICLKQLISCKLIFCRKDLQTGYNVYYANLG